MVFTMVYLRADLRRNILDEAPARDDVCELHSQADAQQRLLAGQPTGNELAFEIVPLRRQEFDGFVRRLTVR
ncbi:MAG: hypothetical protein A2Z25_23495 [Planctomycetes bacterium RBG_16_55_9]|nr:MAG: hypothetical protein A2Z25_23495 [Planctomycetes bacterium RBG_16_55_9]